MRFGTGPLPRRACYSAIVGLTAALISGASYAGAAPRSQPPIGKHVVATDRGPHGERYRADTLLVGFKPEVSAASVAELHRSVGTSPLRAFPALHLQVVKLKSGLSVEDAAQRYRADPRVRYAEPDYRVSAQATPNDPRFQDQWALHNTGQTGGTTDADIDAPEAWNVTTGSSGVVVAVIDTGLDTTHPDLAGNLWVNSGEIPGNGIDDDGNGYVDDVHGINAMLGTGDPSDDNGHGTHVAGTIGASGNNGVGVVGVNWNVRLLPCKFLNAGGMGYTSDAVTCLEYVRHLRDRGEPIVASNNSWGGTEGSQALADAIDAQREILFVAAAGNNLQDDDYIPFYPASYDLPNIISVASTVSTDFLAGTTNFGSDSVQLAAPGEFILSTVPGGQYGYLSGSSMAAAHVTGVAALVKGMDSNRDWRDVRNLVLAGADPLPSVDDKTIVGRRLNAFGSVSCANRPLIRAVRPPGTATVGVPMTLRILSINCGSPAGPITVTTSQGEAVTFRDDGVAPDQAAGDGVFTGTWTPLRIPEKLNVSSPAGAVTIRVPPPYIAHYLPDANTRVGYTQRLVATNTVGSTSWSIVSGTLPRGLSLGATTGVISGHADLPGVSIFTVRLSDAWGVAMTRDMSIRVDTGPVREELARTLHETVGGTDARAIALDASGNVYVMGSIGGLATFVDPGLWVGVGKNYLAKYSSTGTLAWLKRYDTGYLRAIAIDAAGAIYAAGGTNVQFSGHTLLVKFDASGTVLWSQTYANGSETDMAMDVAVNSLGDVFLAGISNDSGPDQMFIQKLDASGGSDWIRTFSNGVVDYGYAVGCDGLGNAYLGGSTAVSVPDPGGSHTEYDYVVRKYDAGGGLAWGRTYDDSGSRYDFLADLAVTASGDVYALGAPEETAYIGYLTMKFGNDGTLRWVKRYVPETTCYAEALSLDAAENVYVTGTAHNFRDYDYLTVKYDRWGDLIWTQTTDARGNHPVGEGDVPFGVAVDGSGHIFVAGMSSNRIDSYDMLLVRYGVYPGPGEASSSQTMTADRGAGSAVTVHYQTGCAATDHRIVWGTGPIVGAASWSGTACGLGASGLASFDPGDVLPDSFLYFVIVAQDANNEGSYGHDSQGQERPVAVGLGACQKPVYLQPCP